MGRMLTCRTSGRDKETCSTTRRSTSAPTQTSLSPTTMRRRTRSTSCAPSSDATGRGSVRGVALRRCEGAATISRHVRYFATASYNGRSLTLTDSYSESWVSLNVESGKIGFGSTGPVAVLSGAQESVRFVDRDGAGGWSDARSAPAPPATSSAVCKSKAVLELVIVSQ